MSDKLNLVRNTIKSSVSAGASQIDLDTATSPYQNPPNPDILGRGFMIDNLDSPSKWEEVEYTARSSITGGYRLSSVTRNISSSTGSAQAFDAGHYFIGAPSVADAPQMASFNLTPDSGTYTISQANHYIKIGRLYIVFFDFQITAITSAGSGALELGGLPANNAVVDASGGGLQRAQNHTASSMLAPHVDASGNLLIRKYTASSGISGGNLQHSELNANFRVAGMVSYRGA